MSAKRKYPNNMDTSNFITDISKELLGCHSLCFNTSMSLWVYQEIYINIRLSNLISSKMPLQLEKNVNKFWMLTILFVFHVICNQSQRIFYFFKKCLVYFVEGMRSFYSFSYASFHETRKKKLFLDDFKW